PQFLLFVTEIATTQHYPLSLHDALPIFAIASNDVEHAFWQHTVDNLDQRQNRQRSVFGRLHDYRVAHAQCWGQLPYGNHHWPVPWANCANHAERTVEDLCGGLTVFHKGVVRGFKGGSSAQPRR